MAPSPDGGSGRRRRAAGRGTSDADETVRPPEPADASAGAGGVPPTPAPAGGEVEDSEPASWPGPDDDAASISERLYGLDPEAFVATRDEAVRALRSGGRRDDAAAVKALRKPSVSAWALNRLVREDRVQVDALLSLGDELRRAQRTLSGDDLRELTGQRHRVVRAVAQRAADLAADAGRALGPAAVDAVARSLDAALSDPAAAQALLDGRLTTDIVYAGLGVEADEGPPELRVVRDAEGAGGSSTDGAAGQAEGGSGRSSAGSRAAARRALAAAEKDATEAEHQASAAGERHERATAAADAAHLHVAAAEQTLAAATAELESARHEEEVAERALALATKTRDRALERADAAARRLAALRTDH